MESSGAKAPNQASSLPPPRAVLDSNVWLDLLLFADPRCAALRAAIDAGLLRPVIDEACLEEWRRVLAYPQWGLTAARQQALYQAVQQWLVPVPRLASVELPRCRDRDDQKFLDLAGHAQALLLLSRDRDLLKLARPCRRRALFHIVEPGALQAGLPVALQRPSPSAF